MEAAAVAGAAAARGATAHAIKVVSDLAGGSGDDPIDVRLRRRDLLRFKALAARLVAGRLAPALDEALAGYSPSVRRR